MEATFITIITMSMKNIIKANKHVVILILSLLLPAILYGKDGDIVERKLPAATITYEPVLKFLQEVVVPLAKQNPVTPEANVSVVFEKSKDGDPDFAYIVADFVRYVSSIPDENETVGAYRHMKPYAARIDGINIILRTEIPGMIKPVHGKFITLRGLDMPLMIDDREASWLFALEKDGMILYNFIDFGLPWLKGVPREFYDPGYKPILKLDPNIPRNVYPRPKVEAPSTFLPVN